MATVLSRSNVVQALAAGPGGGVMFPMPTGLPTLLTYVSLPSGPGGMSLSGPLSMVAFVPLFILGLLITSALEAVFLYSLSKRINREPIAFFDGVKNFILRMVGVNLLRAALVVALQGFDDVRRQMMHYREEAEFERENFEGEAATIAHGKYFIADRAAELLDEISSE